MKRLEIENITKQEFKNLLQQSIPSIVKSVVEEIRKDGLNQTERFLTMPEAEKLLDMKKSLIQKKCRDGILPHYRQGRNYFFLYSELSYWIKEGKINTIADYQSEFEEFLAKKWAKNRRW